jgi:hypothetical protein
MAGGAPSRNHLGQRSAAIVSHDEQDAVCSTVQGGANRRGLFMANSSVIGGLGHHLTTRSVQELMPP